MPKRIDLTTMPFLQTPRLTFHYRSHGRADGLPVLLLHGSYATSRWWQPLLNLLPDDLLAVAPDLRGCGGSEKPDHGYRIAEQAADLDAFVQGLAWRDFDLVAHSSSGAIAMEWLLTRPGLARSLILVDSVPAEGLFSPPETMLALDNMARDVDLLRQALQLLMPTLDLIVPENADFFAQLVEDASQMAPPAFTAVAASLNQWNRFANVNRLTLPALLIWGDQDIVVDRAAQTRTLIALPGANNLEILHNVGHSPMIEAPLTLAEKIVEFITEDFAEFADVRAAAYEGQGMQDKKSS